MLSCLLSIKWLQKLACQRNNVSLWHIFFPFVFKNHIYFCYFKIRRKTGLKFFLSTFCVVLATSVFKRACAGCEEEGEVYELVKNDGSLMLSTRARNSAIFDIRHNALNACRVY